MLDAFNLPMKREGRMKRKVSDSIVCAMVVGLAVSGTAWSQCASAGKAAGDATCPSGACGLKAAPMGDGNATVAGAKQAVLNTAALSALLRAKTPVTILDARAGKWDDGKRIPGAKTVNASSSADEIAAAAPDKAALVVTYCSNLQCPASGKLAEKLRTLGYSNVMEYPEGIAGWIAGGNETTETTK